MDVLLLPALASAWMCLPSRCVAMGIYITIFSRRLLFIVTTCFGVTGRHQVHWGKPTLHIGYPIYLMKLVQHILLCRIWSSDSGGYEQLYLLFCFPAALKLVSCLAYFSTLKMKTKCSSETVVNFKIIEFFVSAFIRHVWGLYLVAGYKYFPFKWWIIKTQRVLTWR
jgi:hypothetical protein